MSDILYESYLAVGILQSCEYLLKHTEDFHFCKWSAGVNSLLDILLQVFPQSFRHYRHAVAFHVEAVQLANVFTAFQLRLQHHFLGDLHELLSVLHHQHLHCYGVDNTVAGVLAKVDCCAAAGVTVDLVSLSHFGRLDHLSILYDRGRGLTAGGYRDILMYCGRFLDLYIPQAG